MPTVLVTRASADAAPLEALLHEAGLATLRVPLVERVWRLDAVRRAATHRSRWDGLVATSASAVHSLARAGVHPRADRVAAVGPKTARALDELGYAVHVVPQTHTASALLQALGPVRGHWLFPRAEVTSSGLEELLAEAGATVHDVVAYANQAPEGYQDALRAVWDRVDAVTLLSGSAAARLAEAGLPERPTVAIGPSTATAARAAGLPVHRVASPHTIEGVVAAVLALLQR